MCHESRGSAGMVQQEVTVAGRWRRSAQGSLSPFEGGLDFRRLWSTHPGTREAPRRDF